VESSASSLAPVQSEAGLVPARGRRAGMGS